ncbi:MAG: type II secretion system protein N [Pseudomonadales bacterium]|nr:type II secretion system protein N [Pseudomonadales bacterium]
MKLRYYILLATFSCFFFVVALFPAALAWKLLPQSLTQALPIKVEQVGGTLWDGFIVGSLSSGPVRGSNVFAWDLNPLWLLMADLSSGLHVEGGSFKLTGSAHVGLFGKGFSDLNGKVDTQLVNDLLKQFGAKAAGELVVRDVTLDFGSGTEVNDATGTLSWAGGPVSYRQGRNSQNLDLPAVKGTLTQQDGGVLLSVVESKTQARLAELTLKGPVGGVVVYKRVMKLAGLSEPEDEDAVLVQIQQPIFM